MTVRVTTISGGAGVGVAVGRYYSQLVERQKDVAAERLVDGPEAGVGVAVGGYYESASGAFWMGSGAERLGLSGVPGKWDIARLVDGIDADGQQLGRKFGDTSARAFDVTFSVQKEVSILWAAADAGTRQVIEQALVDAATAVLDDQVEARAATRMRTGPNGDFLSADKKPVMVDAEGPAVAIIPEFTSRKGDPQLHVHALVSSKVWEPTTERWLALEARELKQDQRAMSALFHAGLETELSKQAGVAWGARTYRYARTINGISSDLVDTFSQRRADVDARLETKLARFEETLGHAPTPQQRWRLEREAAVDSRPSKSAEHLDFEGWRSTIETHTGMSSADLVQSATGNLDVTHTMTQAMLDDMVAAAVGELSDTKSSWTRGDFKAELTRVLPPGLAVSPTELVAFVNTQTDRALGELLQVTPATVDRPNMRWTTADVLGQEAKVLERFDRATTVEIAPNPDVATHAPGWLDGLQLAAAGRVASDSDFELVEGLAGTGKTTMLSVAVDTLTAQDRAVFGVAQSAAAAQVLGDETLMPTENISKFLWEHTQRSEGPSPEYELEAGGTLIVDEAGMVSTPQWDQITELAQVNGWRLVVVGDGYQFSAVGRGGIFDHLVNTLPDHRISRLEQVHRFDAPWEADASAQLRQGDASVLDVYEANNRIIATGPDKSLVDVVTDLYMERHDTGVDVGVFAATNAQVGELNVAIQTALGESGQLGSMVALESDTNPHLYLEDQIETRKNDRNLITDQGSFVKNRDRWTITGNTEDGGLVVSGSSGTVTLPADYVDDHINLAYAQTGHASQGRTISGTSIYAYDPEHSPTDRAGLYVPMTRGKHENLAVVQADTVPIAKQHLVDAVSRRWIDTPAITHLHQDNPQQRQPVEPVPLAEQVDAANQLLGEFEQQSLFTDAAPSPVVQPETPAIDPARRHAQEASRSEAKGRQEPEFVPTTRPEPEPIVVLSPAELAKRLAVVDRLGWGVDNALDEIGRIEATQTDVTGKYRQALTTHNELVETRNTHAENKPRMRGVKQWQATLTSYDRSLASSRRDLDRFEGTLNDLKTRRSDWGHYRSLTVQMQVGGARNELAADRQARGLKAANDPTIIDRLGMAPGDPEAFTLWKDAAGAISQHNTFAHDHPNHAGDRDIDHYSISRQLKADTTTAIKTLGERVGIEHVPDLQPKTIDRDIGRDLGLGL